MSPGAAHSALVWLRAEQASLVRPIAARAGFTIAGAGGPEADRGKAASAALGVPHVDDLRAALANTDARLILLADPGAFADGSSSPDATLLRTLSIRGVRIVSLEPVPAALVSAPPRVAASAGGGEDALAAAASGEWARPVPLARWHRPFQEARELLESFGAVRSAGITCLGHPSDGSLGARLFDALDLLGAFLGNAETLDASYVGTQSGRALHALPGESLRGLRGDLTANLRFADGRAACIFASDRAGQWERSLTLVGAGGRLRVTDAGLEWIDGDGKRLDRSRGSLSGDAGGEFGSGAASVALIAEQIRTALESGAGSPGAPGFARTIASAQAALLSARTREGERPGTLLRMAGLDEHE